MPILTRRAVCALFCVLPLGVRAIHSQSSGDEADIMVNDGTVFDSRLPFANGVTSPEELSALARLLQSPAMAVIRTTRCPVCRELVKSMNQDSKSLATLMSKVIAVDIGDGVDQSKWRANHGYAETYVPRVYFMNSNGSFVDILAPRDDKYMYSFWKGDQLEPAISKLLQI
eukprot:TRINITY_DN56438_c0_g1_i1.p1 TRINITY_DN56438_c0_g1~~TRINITY_DN56438_c0_g1_i1.p1  ORF type:complete len:196 (-),score=13.45 TRINITY_DN56438_c0_g1_i1:272-784(-)